MCHTVTRKYNSVDTVETLQCTYKHGVRLVEAKTKVLSEEPTAVLAHQTCMRKHSSGRAKCQLSNGFMSIRLLPPIVILQFAVGQRIEHKNYQHSGSYENECSTVQLSK